MNATARSTITIIAVYIFHTCYSEHLDGICFHVFAHLQFVFFQLNIKCKYIQTPFILFVFIKRYLIVVIRQHLAKTAHTHCPVAGFSQCIFESATDLHFSNFTSPSLPAATALVSKATQVISFITKEVPV